MHRVSRRGGIALLALALTGALPARSQTPETPPTPGPAPGTPVTLQLMETVSTKHSKKGDRIRLRVYAPVVVEGKTLIAQDATAQGEITSVRGPSRFGRRGQLKLKVDHVLDPDGNRIPLEPYKSGERFAVGGAAVSTAGAILLGPVGLIGGGFIKGRHVTVEEGTRIIVKVAR